MPHLITSENDTRKNSQQPQEIHDKFLQDYSLKKTDNCSLGFIITFTIPDILLLPVLLLEYTLIIHLINSSTLH